MDENQNNNISDDEIAKKAGYYVPDSDPGEEPDEEGTDDDFEEDVDDDSEADSDTETESEEETEEESDEESDDDDSDETDDEEEDEEEDDKNSKSRKRTVPYSKLKTERDKVKTLSSQVEELMQFKDSIKDLAELIQDTKKSKHTSEEDSDDVDNEAAALAKELEEDGIDLDQKSLSKILKKTMEMAKKKFGTVPQDLKDKLKILDELNEEKKQSQTENEFNSEWESAEVKLKKLYPNATDEMLKEAKNEMYKLAHSSKFNTYELMDIFYSPKNKKKFDILLKVSPHKKSGEKSKDYKVNVGDDKQRSRDVKFEELTPEIMRARDEEDNALNNSAPEVKDYKVNNPIK